jgi:hypothetical protein
MGWRQEAIKNMNMECQESTARNSELCVKENQKEAC